MVDIGKTTLVVKLDGQAAVEIDVAAAYYDTVSLYEKVAAECEGQSDATINHAYYMALVQWGNDGGLTLTMSSAMMLDRHIAEEFEKFKKKLPGLPISVTASESPPANLPSSTGQSSNLTLQEFAEKMNSPFVEQTPPSHPDVLESSSKQPQETQTQPA